jgi:hypothetical protein
VFGTVHISAITLMYLCFLVIRSGRRSQIALPILLLYSLWQAERIAKAVVALMHVVTPMEGAQIWPFDYLV